jgi:hypothetical protein
MRRSAVSDCGRLIPVLTVAALTGCGSTQTIGTPGAMPQSRPAAHAMRGKSWMLPEAKRRDLLYVSDQATLEVYVFSYPRGKLEGTLTGFPQWPSGLCIDKSQNIWIALGSNAQIVEYAHGGTSPIGILDDAGQEPVGCAVDPSTGNLAAASLEGGVSIYAGARGSPVTYADPDLAQAWACGYDKKGNLFVDGFTSSRGFQFAELPKRGSSLENITLNANFEWPGGVQWDGTYVAVGDAKANVIYQTNGAGGQVVGHTQLDGASTVGQFWKIGKRVVAGSYDTGKVGYWSYPGGGEPAKTLSGFTEPFGVAVSKGRLP